VNSRQEILNLKKWTAEEIQTPGNFDFSYLKDQPQNVIWVAWLWELDRDLHSGNKPFFTEFNRPQLENLHPEKYPAAKLLGLRDYLPSVAKDFNEGRDVSTGECGPNGYARAELIEIDWRKPVGEIVAAFKADVEKRHVTIDQPQTGNRRAVRAWMNDLRLYRYKNAGLPKSDVRLSFPNWNHAHKRAEKRIVDRYLDLKRIAGDERFELEMRQQGENVTNWKDWRSHFIKL